MTENSFSTEITQNKPTSDKHLRDLRRVTWLGMFVNITLTILKMLAGVFANSQVLVADAVHSFSDLATDAAVLVGSRYWDRPADREHQHGHAKIETLVTFFIGLALFAVALGLIRSAFHSINGLIGGKSIPLPGTFALIAAILSILLKEWLYRITIQVGRRVKSAAVLANAWHHRSDALSSIPAAVAVAFCLVFGEKYTFLDPVGTIVVSCMILYAAVEIVRPTLSTLLDRGLTDKQIEEIKACVLENEDVLGIHKIRTRPLGGNRMAVDLHMQVDPLMAVIVAHRLSHHVASDITGRFPNIVDVVTHLEPEGDD